MSTKKKSVNTKKLQAAVSDFTKLYSLDMNTPVFKVNKLLRFSLSTLLKQSLVNIPSRNNQSKHLL